MPATAAGAPTAAGAGDGMKIRHENCIKTSVVNIPDEASPMLSPEMLVIIGGGAVLPYLAEAAWYWLKCRRQHRHGARRPR